jgi:hypothetical protein
VLAREVLAGLSGSLVGDAVLLEVRPRPASCGRPEPIPWSVHEEWVIGNGVGSLVDVGSTAR